MVRPVVPPSRPVRSSLFNAVETDEQAGLVNTGRTHIADEAVVQGAFFKRIAKPLAEIVDGSFFEKLLARRFGARRLCPIH